MKIKSNEKLKQELTSMFQYKWSCINHLLTPLIIQDIIKFIEGYKNETDS